MIFGYKTYKEYRKSLKTKKEIDKEKRIMRAIKRADVFYKHWLKKTLKPK